MIEGLDVACAYITVASVVPERDLVQVDYLDVLRNLKYLSVRSQLTISQSASRAQG